MSKQSLKKNYFYSLIYQVLCLIVPFITAPYLSRILEPDGIGIYSYTHSYVTYFCMLASLGTSSYGMREISRARDNKETYSKIFWEIELLSIITTTFSLILWLIPIYFSTKYRIYFIAFTPLIVANIFDISWFFIGQEKFGYTVFWNLICKITGTIFIFVFIKEKSDLFLYILLTSLIYMIGNASMWCHLPKMITKMPVLSEIRLKIHLKETSIYFIPTIATSIYMVLDKTLIGLITNNEYQNGYYEQSTKIINIAKSVILSAVNVVMSARISYLFVENKITLIKDSIEKSLSFIFLIGFLSVFGIFSVSDKFVPLFFGSEYEPVIFMMYAMAPILIIASISNCLGSQYFTPAGLRAKSAKYIIYGAISNLFLNLILIPVWGAVGAIIGSLLAEIFISFLYFANCNGFLKISTVIKLSLKRILSGFIMMCCVIYISSKLDCNLLYLILEILLCIMIYFILLFIMKDELLVKYLFSKIIKR